MGFAHRWCYRPGVPAETFNLRAPTVRGNSTHVAKLSKSICLRHRCHILRTTDMRGQKMCPHDRMGRDHVWLFKGSFFEPAYRNSSAGWRAANLGVVVPQGSRWGKRRLTYYLNCISKQSAVTTPGPSLRRRGDSCSFPNSYLEFMLQFHNYTINEQRCLLTSRQYVE